MQTYLIMTLLGTDRAGLVRELAEIVTKHGGNWLESRMSRLAGQFAGIARISCTESAGAAIIEDLKAAMPDLSVTAVREAAMAEEERQLLTIDVTGNDRPGIVRELTAIIASQGANVEELETSIESAAMAGHPIFRAVAKVSLPQGSDSVSLITAIESLGADLTVDVS